MRLADGKPAWDGRTVALPENSMPSGRGFTSGDRYFLPLSSAEVVGVDLAAGKIVQVSKSRKGSVPGNLICHQGKIISQGLEAVDAYCQLDAVQAEIRRRLGRESQRRRGDLPCAAKSCWTPTSGRRRSLLSAARTNWSRTRGPASCCAMRCWKACAPSSRAYRRNAAEIQRLLDNPPQQATFLRLMAGGLRQAGESAAAFEYYQKLIDLEPGRRPLDQIDKTLAVRRDRWIRGRLAELRSEAKGEAAAEIDRAVEARLKSAVAARSVEPLQRFFDYFGDQPAAAAARGELVRRLKDAGRLLEAELAAAPAARNRPRSPASAAPRNTTTLADRQGGSHRRRRRRTISATLTAAWASNCTAARSPSSATSRSNSTTSRRAIVAYDGFGREQWQVPLTQDGQRQDFPYNPAWNHVRARGHLLLVSLGWKMLAIDTLGSGPKGAPRVLWIQDLIGSDLDSVNRQLPGCPGRCSSSSAA